MANPFLRLLIVLLCPALAVTAADGPYLVRDLPSFEVKDSMEGLARFWATIGTNTWFVAYTDVARPEIFKTDGTPGGTVQVTGGAGSPDSDDHDPFVGVVNEKLIYAGVDAGGDGLFALDTATGTATLLARLDPFSLRRGVLREGLLYFRAELPGTNDCELWRTDGTPQGTTFIQLMPGEQGSFGLAKEPDTLFAAGDAMYFFGRTPAGTGLHRTDGTAGNTTLLHPLTTSELYNDIGGVIALGTRFLFHLRASPPGTGTLWVTDGASGTVAIGQTFPFEPLGIVGTNLFFASSEDIWVTDGTAAGTRRTDIERRSIVRGAGVLGQRLLFFASTFVSAPAGLIDTLYATEGTAATTHPIVSSSKAIGTTGFVLGNELYFAHDDGVHGTELWATDGTTARMLADIGPGPRSGAARFPAAAVRSDGRAIFAGTGDGTGTEPWVTDGTEAGTRLLANLRAEDWSHGSSPRNIRAAGDRVFFVASLPAGDAIGVSDGTDAGTNVNVIDPRSGGASGDAVAANRYFFRAGPGLYSTDGTIAGTTLLYENARSSTAMNSGLLFEGKDETLWFSDGTIAGTHAIPGVTAGFTFRLFEGGERGWFFYNKRLWTIDPQGQIATEIIPAEPILQNLYTLIHRGSEVFFFESSDHPKGPRLWRSDGTSEGTRVVKTFAPPSSGSPDFIGVAGALVLFEEAGKLYRTDGTESGTIELPVAAPCAGVASIGNTVILASVVSSTIRIWRTDGTAAGTSELVQMRPRHVPFVPCPTFAALNGRVYFAGWDAAHGYEPWVTDGTVSGTKMLADLNPGPSHSTPVDLVTAGQRLLFSAETLTLGRELWAIGPMPLRRRAVGVR